MLSEIKETEKDKYRMIPLIYGIKKKAELNKTESRMEVTRDWGVRKLGRCCLRYILATSR